MKPTLYHGTDMRIAYLSQHERYAYKDACLSAVKHLWQFFEPYSHLEDPKCVDNLETLKSSLPQELFPNLFANLCDKITLYKAYLNGNPKYQYDKDVTYLCSSQLGAQNYSYRAFAGGEFGLIAFRMLEACKAMGIKYDNAGSYTVKSIRKVENFALTTPQPAIIPITDYKIDLLSLEDDKSISKDMFELLSEEGVSVPLKYCGDLKLDLSKAIRL